MDFDISKMLSIDVYDHPVSKLEIIETHISWVILTGEIVYKIKKPVDFGFLDFSTMDKRKECCKQELRLNRRLAPDIYLDVVSINGTKNKPKISSLIDDKDAFEFAVKMKQFPQSSQLDNMLAEAKLTNKHIDELAEMIADFHESTAVASSETKFGLKNKIKQSVIENFELIDESSKKHTYRRQLISLKLWSLEEFKNLEPVFEQRKKDGFIRECHGDMHLRNLAWIKNKPLAFDCIEFNPELRWIDVMSEIAFLIMDLQVRNQQHLADRFLNKYLEITGDYAGLKILSFYLCYRAMVRVKVEALLIEQLDHNSETLKDEFKALESYLDLALSYLHRPKPKLIIMRGLSASGKSTVSQRLLESIGAIRIRSDVERKRMFDIEINQQLSTDIDEGIYTIQASQQTYAKLLDLSIEIINCGFSVIVDAAFLHQEQRISFQTYAKRLSIPFTIVEVTASTEELRKRIANRTNDASDANLNVLNNQLTQWKPLTKDESLIAFTINTEEQDDIEKLVKAITADKKQ